MSLSHLRTQMRWAASDNRINFKIRESISFQPVLKRQWWRRMVTRIWKSGWAAFEDRSWSMIERRTTKSGRQRRGTGILSQAGFGIREERRGFVIHISLGRTKHFLVSIVE